eukprot:2465991-Alexandrium_andersonii.AAC.1
MATAELAEAIVALAIPVSELMYPGLREDGAREDRDPSRTVLVFLFVFDKKFKDGRLPLRLSRSSKARV